MKQLACKDMGMDCKYVSRAENDDQLMRQMTDHHRKEHGLAGDRLSQELESKGRAAIQTA